MRSAVVLGLTHVIAAVGLFFPSKAGFLAFLVAHYLCVGWGLGVGLHRFFSHGAFRTNRFVQAIIGYLAVLNLQGGPIFWAAIHRTHHLRSDGFGDAHSASRGFLWSHIGWIFYTAPNGYNHLRTRSLTQDLSKCRELVFLDRHSHTIYLASAAVVYLIFRRWDIVLWAFPIRTVVGWHTTWLLNSYLHGASFRRDSVSEPRNSFFVSVIGYGEGWHLNHHNRPDSASAQFRWWQFDPTYWHIKLLCKVGLAEVNQKTRSGPRMGSDLRGKKPRDGRYFPPAA